MHICIYERARTHTRVGDACVRLVGLIHLSNGISTLYRLFNSEIWLICKFLVWFICLTAYQLTESYLMLKFDLFLNV